MRRVLIVDHDENALIGLEWLLEIEGYRTTTAWGIKDAMNVAGDEAFDLLLIDEEMNRRESAESLQALRKRHPAAGLVFMHTKKGPSSSRTPVAPSVCKWELSEVRACVRHHFAA